jgi:hypothetical protein
MKDGVEVVICHPKLVETGLDLLAFPTLYFFETRLFTPHAATGLAPIVAYRAKASGAGEVFGPQGHNPNHLFAFDGQDASCGDDGGEGLTHDLKRIPEHRRTGTLRRTSRKGSTSLCTVGSGPIAENYQAGVNFCFLRTLRQAIHVYLNRAGLASYGNSTPACIDIEAH